jgi:hypothetical protein
MKIVQDRSYSTEKDKPWLENTKNGMKFSYCNEYGSRRQTLFVQGCKIYKMETIKLHEQSKTHLERLQNVWQQVSRKLGIWCKSSMMKISKNDHFM